MLALSLFSLLAFAPATAAPPQAAPAATPIHEEPTELFAVERVVDGDTLHVSRAGRLEKLRLLSVDTEERLLGSPSTSPSKPETVFGEECARWAEEFFAGLAEDGTTRVGLVFPGGEERRDVYDRLLCHVVLADGTDFNLLLVELGKSPYFNKYGNSLIAHDAFVAAQKRARAARRGIWDPATNRPRTEGAPAARRPYEELLPWWEARARAIEAFRERRRAQPGRDVEAELPEELEAAVGREVTVLGEIYRIFDEEDGGRTVLMRSTVPDRALRVRIGAELVGAHATLDLAASLGEFRQNYLFVRGELERDRAGFQMRSAAPDRWQRAGPDPDEIELEELVPARSR